MNDLAEECHGVVLYPEQCRLVNPLGCWNWHDSDHQSAEPWRTLVDRGHDSTVVAETASIPRGLVAGMSAGGAIAVILGQEYPDLYAAVGVHSGVASGIASDLLSAMTAMSNGPASRSAGKRGHAQSSCRSHHCFSRRSGLRHPPVQRRSGTRSSPAANAPHAGLVRRRCQIDPARCEHPKGRTVVLLPAHEKQGTACQRASYGSFTAPATLGPAAVRRGPTRTRVDQTPLGRWCGSFSSSGLKVTCRNSGTP